MSEVKIRAVYTTCEEFVPLKQIESINLSIADKEEEIVAKLKDDKLIRIRTKAGYEYTFSLKTTMELLNDSGSVNDSDEMGSVFFNCWLKEIGAEG